MMKPNIFRITDSRDMALKAEGHPAALRYVWKTDKGAAVKKHPVFGKRGRLRQIVAHVLVLACCIFLSGSVACDGQTSQIDFNIPAQEIVKAIDMFVKTTNFSLIHTVGGQVDIKTNEVLGKYTPDEALSIMLEGTGLVHKFTSETVVCIVKDAASTPNNQQANK